jgi:hypothetical protein
MLEEVMGIPAHPLLVHAAVVFVPLLAILAALYAFVPFVRSHTRWVLGLLALGAPVAAFLAKLSGDAFFARLEKRDSISEEFYPKLEAHQALGNNTLYATIALAVLTLVLVYLVRPPSSSGHAAGRTGSSRVVSVVLGLLCLAAAVVSVYYVVQTGDSGAKAVWEGS